MPSFPYSYPAKTIGDYMYIHIKLVEWDKDSDWKGLATKNLYIDDKGMGYDPADVCGGLHGCDVESCESDYVDELPDDVEEYATQYPYDHEDFETGAVSYISKSMTVF